MRGKIFINYRRDDSAPYALAIAQYLEKALGFQNIFLDIDRMRAGQRFPKVLEERLAECSVMLTIIGPAWLGLRNEAGLRRLDDPDDWVRLELSQALARGITSFRCSSVVRRQYQTKQIYLEIYNRFCNTRPQF